MSFVEAEFPRPLYCLVRAEALHDWAPQHVGAFEEAMLVAAAAIEARAIAFRVILRNGAMWKRLPIHAICFKPCDPIAPHVAAYWDAFSYGVVFHHHRLMRHFKPSARCRDGVVRHGRYLGTLDFYGESYAEEPSEEKDAHLIAADDGPLLAMPNNRVLWQQSSWTKAPDADARARMQRWRPQSGIWSSERGELSDDNWLWRFGDER